MQDHLTAGWRWLCVSVGPLVRDYRHATQSRAASPGDIWVWAGVDADGATRRIVNLLTQNMRGEGPAAKPDKATLENVGHTLKALAQYVQKEGINSLALPRRPRALGGWNGLA